MCEPVPVSGCGEQGEPCGGRRACAAANLCCVGAGAASGRNGLFYWASCIQSREVLKR